MNVTLRRDFSFEAAHRNLSAPAGAKNARLHGHSYGVSVEVSGTVGSRFGWLVDFADLKAGAAPVIEQLDHRLLNEIAGMGDTSLGDVREWLRTRLALALPDISLCSVRIKGDVEWRPIVRRVDAGEGISQQIAFGFASAHYLPQLPTDHKCRRMHGHSFGVTISTPDSQRLIDRARSLHEKLDHQLLNDIPGLDNPTSENLTHWWWDKLGGKPGLIDEIMIHETCTTGCIYRGES